MGLSLWNQGIPNRKTVSWYQRWFQIINRENCSIHPASDDRYYFPIRFWGWQGKSLGNML